MKKLGAILALAVLLSGCSGENRELDRAMSLRSKLLRAEGCSFTAKITADYGDSLQSFTLDCQGDAQGAVRFQVTEPHSISGITGILSDTGGKLTFDDEAVHFDYLTDDQLSPISAPWVFLKTLRAGYLTAAGMEGELNYVTARDSYQEDALLVDFWLEAGNIPIRSEILYRGRRILTLEIQNFRISSAHA